MSTDRVIEARKRAQRERLMMQLDRGTEVTVKGSRYRVLRIRDNGEINCWGPLGKRPGTYTVRWEDITKVHKVS